MTNIIRFPVVPKRQPVGCLSCELQENTTRYLMRLEVELKEYHKIKQMTLFERLFRWPY